ncbi:unnamed protein product [Rangifer tarandus platyrhynchus]|uniref:Uncharacterized protein n=2 Tax=Rangifer tarandus platyrhynchus TaxID=3082113 RepID=A0ACB0FMA4_RANTA|nr:unnamed protein product [Rangifer tarandus platyrhynchus]CAI9714260.1 unnamed protein product [Rangifer tarandus platyrhynchus]
MSTVCFPSKGKPKDTRAGLGHEKAPGRRARGSSLDRSPDCTDQSLSQAVQRLWPPLPSRADAGAGDLPRFLGEWQHALPDWR